MSKIGKKMQVWWLYLLEMLGPCQVVFPSTHSTWALWQAEHEGDEPSHCQVHVNNLVLQSKGLLP